MARLHFNVDQGSGEWFRLRSGVPTASEFDKIITPAKGDISKQRFRYQAILVAQRMLNWQPQSLDTITHIAAGKENEPAAIAQFEFVSEIQTTPVGFATTDDGRFGASPDRVIGLHETRVDQTVEIKAPSIPTQAFYLFFGQGDAYRVQVQGQLFVCEADKAVFYSYHPRTPPHLVETGRDEEFIRKMRSALEQFSDELEALTELAKKMGDWQAFAEVLPPLDAELVSEEEMAHIIEDPWATGESHRMGA